MNERSRARLGNTKQPTFLHPTPSSYDQPEKETESKQKDSETGLSTGKI